MSTHTQYHKCLPLQVVFLHHHHGWASLLVSRRNEKGMNCYAKSSLGQLTLAEAQAQEMNLLYYIILLILSLTSLLHVYRTFISHTA